MSSQGADSADQLLHLIYRHLKENGYRKAAKVLKKHITQKETEVGATLYEIYSSWIKSLDGIGDIKQKSGLDSSPVRKSHLSDYAVERVDEVKPVKSEIFEKIEEPDSKPIIHDGSVSSFDKPVPTTVVTKFCKNSEDHLYLKDECDGDQLHTPTYHIDSVPPSVEKVTVPQEKELSITCDVVVDAGSSERELSRYSEEEEEKLQQNGAATPEATAVKPSAAVAVVGEGQSSDNSKDSENEEEVPVHIPAEGTATALLKSSQHTSSQAIATPKSCAAEKAESSGSESSYDLCSEEGTTQEQNIMVTPKAEPLSGSPNKASRVSAATPVKPNYTPGPTAAYSKTEENSNGEDVSESEDEIPPEQNADVTTKAKPLSEKTTAVRTSTPVKPSITPGPTTATSKTEDRSESDGKSESEEEIPVTQATFTTPTADTPSPTPAVATKGPSSDSSSEDAHSEDDMLAQVSETSEVTLKAKSRSNSPNKATVVMTLAKVKSSVIHGSTRTPSKTAESSESGDESKTEEEVTSINSTARKSSSTSAAVAHKKITSDSSSEEFHRAQVAPAMKTAVITPKRHEDDDSIDHTTSTTKSTVEVLVPTKRGTSAITNETRMKQKEHSKSKGPVATSGHPRDERENLGCLKSEEEAEEETPVSASDALPKMECKATIQVLQKSSKPFKKVAGGSEDLSNVETTLTSLKTHKAKLCAITPEFSSSDMKNSYTKDDEGPASISVQGVSADSLPVIISVVTLSDAAPKRSKDSIVEELICQTSVDPKDTLKTVAEGRRKKNKKKKKKKKVSALPEEKEIPCIGPAQELLLQNGGTSISLDKLITEAQKASKQPVMEQSKDGVSLKKAGSKSSELVSEVNSEEETGLKTEAAAAIPRAIKRKTSEGKADSVSKSKKKKRVDTEGNTAEPSKDPHFEKYLSLEESKETQALSDDATSVMDLGGSIESKSTTLILSVKALKNIKKKIKKNNKDKEKVKVRDKGSKKNKTTLNMEKGIKTKSAFSSVGLASNWSATKKDLKKVAAIKRLPLALDTHLLDEQRDLQKKKKSDKDSIINSEPQPETRSVKKKNKSNTNKNNPSGKKETEDREDNELQNPGVEQSAPLKKKKKKKKNKLKNKEMNIPFKSGLDTTPSTQSNLEPAKEKKKKNSFKNKQ